MVTLEKFLLVKGDDYTTTYLLGFTHFKSKLCMITIDLSKKQA